MKHVLRSVWSLAIAAGAVFVLSLAGSSQHNAATRSCVGITPEQAEILSHMSIVYLSDDAGEIRKAIRISAVNVQLVNGLGATNGYPPDPFHTGPMAVVNGLGNLFIGYRDGGPTWPVGASMVGSHNLVMGGNRSSSFGGLLAGVNNTVQGAYGSTPGGRMNLALGEASAVCGGLRNCANGTRAHVSGGRDNVAAGSESTVGGGSARTAPAAFNWAAGTLFQTK